MIETHLSNHHQSEDDEVEPRSKRTKMTKIFSLDFLTYLLENEQVWFILKETLEGESSHQSYNSTSHRYIRLVY